MAADRRTGGLPLVDLFNFPGHSRSIIIFFMHRRVFSHSLARSCVIPRHAIIPLNTRFHLCLFFVFFVFIFVAHAATRINAFIFGARLLGLCLLDVEKINKLSQRICDHEGLRKGLLGVYTKNDKEKNFRGK